MYKEITELIGRTPLVRLNRLSKPGSATIYGKVEFFNPGGSVKDRICLNMINEAERQGKLKPGGTIVEPTSGNTGIGLALISAVRGYKLILVMPESMSMERASLLSSYGAQLVLTPAWEGMKGSIREAESLLSQNPSYFMPDQFSNPANPAMHKKTTAPEGDRGRTGRFPGAIRRRTRSAQDSRDRRRVYSPSFESQDSRPCDQSHRRRGLPNSQAAVEDGRAVGRHFRRCQRVRRTTSG